MECIVVVGANNARMPPLNVEEQRRNDEGGQNDDQNQNTHEQQSTAQHADTNDGVASPFIVGAIMHALKHCGQCTLLATSVI